MKKGLLFLVIFVAGILTTLIYQSCGGSSMEAKSSGKGGIKVDAPNNPSGDGDGDGDGDGTGDGDGDGTGDGDGDGTGDGDGDGTGDGDGDGDGDGTGGTDVDHKYNVGTGDTIMFRNVATNNLNTSRFRKLLYYYFLDTVIYENNGKSFADDLTENYCKDSALPHCLHINGDGCEGIGCTQNTQIVRCHSQTRMSDAQKNGLATAFNAIQFDERILKTGEVVTPNCNNPRLFFYGAANKSLDLSLAAKACVEDKKYYATAGGAGVAAIYNSELNKVAAATDDCNVYGAYSWDKTKFTYKYHSGFTTAINAELREVTYVPPTDGKPKVNIRFKDKGSNKTYCANGVFVQGKLPTTPAETDTLFPAAGIKYSIFRTGAQLADASTAEIVYQSPTDGGAKWQFFMDQATAQTHKGGAIMASGRVKAIEDMIEVWVTRAKEIDLAKECVN